WATRSRSSAGKTTSGVTRTDWSTSRSSSAPPTSSRPTHRMKVPILEDLPPLQGKRVLLRADFNVPVDESGRITDDLRIRAALPTIQWLEHQGATVTACTHLGRPKGAPDP